MTFAYEFHLLDFILKLSILSNHIDYLKKKLYHVIYYSFLYYFFLANHYLIHIYIYIFLFVNNVIYKSGRQISRLAKPS